MRGKAERGGWDNGEDQEQKRKRKEKNKKEIQNEKKKKKAKKKVKRRKTALGEFSAAQSWRRKKTVRVGGWKGRERTVNLEYVAIFFRRASVVFRTTPAAIPVARERQRRY